MPYSDMRADHFGQIISVFFRLVTIGMSLKVTKKRISLFFIRSQRVLAINKRDISLDIYNVAAYLELRVIVLRRKCNFSSIFV